MQHRLELISKELSQIAPVREKEPLSRHSTFRVGGEADYYVESRNAEHLERILQVVLRAEIPYKVIGGGSNILVSDRGFRGLVIRNKSSKRTYLENDKVEVDSGVSLARLTKESVSKGLAGLEWAVGIPGSIGGAVVGNAGAYGKSIANVLVETVVLDAKGEKKNIPAADMGFAYRNSNLKGDSSIVVLTAMFQLSKESPDAIHERVAEYTRQRWQRQPGGASAGSVFKNPESAPAGMLIEKAGLKGRVIGGAKISEKHANFIINTGGATAQDVKALIDVITLAVMEKFEVQLEPEIELVGEWK